jgi:hypothetical protein
VRARVAGVVLLVTTSGCTLEGGIENHRSFRVRVTAVNGAPPPTPEAPLPANVGQADEGWTFVVDALDEDGFPDPSFDGFARVGVLPGSVVRVEGPAAVGRNLRFTAGHTEGEARVISVFGPSRLWIEDLGYLPAAPGEVAGCANGSDDDDDVLVDFPNDPGCAFANDMSEETGSYTAGVSQEVHYDRPTLGDVQGHGSDTPYPSVAVEVKTADPSYVVVTRVSSSGFFVTDIGDPLHPQGHNHIFAFNFNTPSNMRVCDRLTLLSGTASEFFGFTEITFPSYELIPIDQGPGCLVPEPVVLDSIALANDGILESLESGLVRLEQFVIPPFFGKDLPVVSGTAPNYSYEFSDNASNCDLNLDGFIDFFDDLEGGCSNACAADPRCVDWIGYASRSNYKLFFGQAFGVCSEGVQCVQVNTSAAGGFDPTKHKGSTIAAVTGTLRNFSGGSLNWTVESRCAEDIVCNFDSACAETQLPSSEACVISRTEDDNDSGTN